MLCEIKQISHTNSEEKQSLKVNVLLFKNRTSEEKYEDFLNKLGVGFMLRKAALASTPTMEITKTGDKWKMVTATALKSVVLEFELVKFFFI